VIYNTLFLVNNFRIHNLPVINTRLLVTLLMRSDDLYFHTAKTKINPTTYNHILNFTMNDSLF